MTPQQHHCGNPKSCRTVCVYQIALNTEHSRHTSKNNQSVRNLPLLPSPHGKGSCFTNDNFHTRPLPWQIPSASCPVSSLAPVKQCCKCCNKATGLSLIDRPAARFPQRVMLSLHGLDTNWYTCLHISKQMNNSTYVHMCLHACVCAHTHTHLHYIHLKWVSNLLLWTSTGNGENCGLPEKSTAAHTGGCVQHHHPHHPWDFFMCTQYTEVLVQSRPAQRRFCRWTTYITVVL
jgi:hypothetical protein